MEKLANLILILIFCKTSQINNQKHFFFFSKKIPNIFVKEKMTKLDGNQKNYSLKPTCGNYSYLPNAPTNTISMLFIL
jgi:hypothetical protein